MSPQLRVCAAQAADSQRHPQCARQPEKNCDSGQGEAMSQQTDVRPLDGATDSLIALMLAAGAFVGANRQGILREIVFDRQRALQSIAGGGL
jgi:hypothetical protein